MPLKCWKQVLRRVAWLSFVGALATPTAASAQATIADCEKIQAADAYNQCLAKFGPPAKSGNIEPERPGDVKSGPDEAAASAGRATRGKGRVAGRHRGRGGAFARRGHGHAERVAHAGRGRKRMTISVGK